MEETGERCRTGHGQLQLASWSIPELLEFEVEDSFEIGSVEDCR